MQYLRAVMSNTNTFLAVILTIVIIFSVTHWNSDGGWSTSPKPKFTWSENVFIMKRLAPNNRNIFFLETSCAFKKKVPPGGLQLTKRQLCSIYSTAKLHPTRQIILYHSCPLHPDFYRRSTKDSQYLLELPNVFVFHDKYENLLRGTLVEQIIEGGLQSSSYRIEHSSDILRILLVYKYGGAYMDLDFISTKSLDPLGHNFIVAESDTQLSNGIFQFEHQGRGNKFLQKMLVDLVYNYNANSWSGNGPHLFRRQFFKFCSVSESVPVTNATTKSCGITVVKPKLFFPIHYNNWKLLFEPKKGNSVKETAKDSYAVHFWNFLSKNEQVRIGENSGYEVLANEYCREIIMSAGDVF